MSNEIKKLIYKNKPTAFLSSATKAGLRYSIYLPDISKHIWFLIPFEEIGDAQFFNEMPAQLLIRYIVAPE